MSFPLIVKLLKIYPEYFFWKSRRSHLGWISGYFNFEFGLIMILRFFSLNDVMEVKNRKWKNLEIHPRVIFDEWSIENVYQKFY